MVDEGFQGGDHNVSFCDTYAVTLYWGDLGDVAASATEFRGISRSVNRIEALKLRCG